MANLIQTSPNGQFAVAAFLEACCVEAFHGRWMSADTWADLIQHVFSLAPEMKFTGKDQVKALSLRSNEKLREAMDIPWNSVPRDHVGIFHRAHQPQGSTRMHCFYATARGSKPDNRDNWFLDLDIAIDLLTK